MTEQQQTPVNLSIDGVALQVPKGTLLVEAVKQAQQEIPVYCYHTKLGPAGLCRVCLVEIEGTPKLQISCNTPVAEGMVVHTQGQKVSAGRSMVLELLLVNHPLDCPICDKGGECDLQDYAMAYGPKNSDLADPKSSKPKGVDLGPTIVLDEERCVVCQRCVRFDEIIVGDQQLVLKDRGHKDMIATATGDPYRHQYTGNVTELCPVGALTSKTYRFKSRAWDLHRTRTSCTQCSVGCPINADVRAGSLLRTMSVETDDAISDGWLCDRGRYNIGYMTAPSRLTQPLYKRNGTFVQIGWDDAFELWSKAIRDALETHGPASIGAIGGGRLTNEESYLLGHAMRKIGVERLDWRAGRQRQATPGRFAGTLADLENAQAILLVGQSSAQTAPVMDLRIRKAVLHRGARLIRLESFGAAMPIPCQDVVTEEAALAAIGDAQRVALVWDGVDLALGARLHAALASRTKFMTYIAGEQPNARGAEMLGLLPRSPEFDARATFAAAREGKLAVLSIFGVNPMLHAPDAGAIEEALERVGFAVVSELFMTATAQLATLVLPVAGSFEKSGTLTNCVGDLVGLAAALDAPEGVQSDFEVIAQLADALDVALPTHEEIGRAVIAAAAVHSQIEFGDSTYGETPRQEPTGEGLRIVVEAQLFSGGGTNANDERIANLRPLPQAALNAADATRFSVKTGDYLDLAAGEKTMHDLLVEVRTGVPQGCLVLIDGLPDDPANTLGDAGARVVNIRSISVAVEA